MTEDEAKTKWCPFVRHSDGNAGVFNSGNRSEDPINISHSGGQFGCVCIGSECMAWRWNVETEIDIPKLPTGYCGLAGKE